MGLLALGTPLDWPETKPLAEHIRSHGITQFLNTWDRWKDRTGKGLLWGDEVRGASALTGGKLSSADSQIEYMVVACDDEAKKAMLSLRQSEILQKLQSVTLDHKLEKYKPKEWYVQTESHRATLATHMQRNDPYIPPRVRKVHARVHARRALLRYTQRPRLRRSGHAIPPADHPLALGAARAAHHAHGLAEAWSYRRAIH